jgi:hypothetical protein
LVEASKRHPVSGNAEGSYLTMQSKEGAVFFVINIVGNFGTVSLPLQRVIRILAWILRDRNPARTSFDFHLAKSDLSETWSLS